MAKQTIIVMSDSHGDRGVVERIRDFYLGKVDAIFHNGDSELQADDSVWQGIQVVAGNMDCFAGFPDRLVTDVKGLRVAQTHGHLYNLHFDFSRLDLWAQEEDADICLYGHLHVPNAFMMGKTLFLNPGSVSQPRGPIAERLYAKIEVTEEVFKVDFMTLQHEIYPGLSKEFSRL